MDHLQKMLTVQILKLLQHLFLYSTNSSTFHWLLKETEDLTDGNMVCYAYVMHIIYIVLKLKTQL